MKNEKKWLIYSKRIREKKNAKKKPKTKINKKKRKKLQNLIFIGFCRKRRRVMKGLKQPKKNLLGYVDIEKTYEYRKEEKR